MLQYVSVCKDGGGGVHWPNPPPPSPLKPPPPRSKEALLYPCMLLANMRNLDGLCILVVAAHFHHHVA